MADGVRDRVLAFDELFARLPQLQALAEPLEQALVLLERCAQQGNKILLCGNGGSAADADHIAAELMKSFVYRRPLERDFVALLHEQCPEEDANRLAAALEAPVAAISLGSQIATLTAFSNDVDYRFAFAQQVFGLGRPGDVLVAISTSGNSANVLHACQVGRARGLSVIGLTGAGGGRMRALCDVALLAPAHQTHLVQELHLPLYHALCLALEERLFARYGKRG